MVKVCVCVRARARMISGFRRKVAENCALLGYYAASSGKFYTDVSGQPIGRVLKHTDGTW